MSEYVVAQAAVLIVPTLGKGPNSFKAKLDAELAAIRREALEIKIEGDTKKLISDYAAAKGWIESQEIEINAKVDTRYLTEIRHRYEDLVRETKKGLVLNLKVAGLQLLPALAQGLSAANASMVQLAQSALVLPGLLSGVVSAFSSVLVGVRGVKDAFREYGEAQKNAASEGLKARSAAVNVRNAYRDLGRSIKDAERNLQDLNAQLRDAPLDEAEAIIRVSEARAEAADKAGKSGLQQQKDIIAIQRAENELADTRLRSSRIVEDVAAANAKGVLGADGVTEATERLSKAVDDAATKQTKLTDALKDLSPNAQQFVETVKGMESQWTAFRNSTQDAMFAGLGGEFTKLAQSDLPIVQKGLTAIAAEINGNLKTAMASLQTDNNKGFLERILGNSAGSQGELDNAIRPFIDGMMRLSAVGSDFLPRLASALTDVTERFNAFVVRADADGSLKEWIDNGLDSLTQLGNSIVNIGSMFNSLAEAFTGSGGTTFLQWLEEASARMAEFMKSDEGQESLKRFFVEARQELAKWKPVLDELPSIMSNLAAAGSAWANMLLPFLRTAAQLLGQHPGLVQAIFTAYMGWKTVAPMVKGVKDMVVSLSEAARNMHVNVFGNAQGFIGKYATGMDTAKNKIGDVAGAIVGPAGLLTVGTTLATFLATKMVAAHDEAGAAADRQKRDLDELRSTLDEVTGAATRATNAMIGKDFREGVNESTGLKNNINWEQLTGKPDTSELAQKVASGDLEGALGMIPRVTAEDIESTDTWRQAGKSLEKAGITSQVLADAVSGNPDAVKKFEAWELEQMRLMAPVGFGGASKATLRGLGVESTDLLDVEKSLSPEVRQRAQASQEIYSKDADLRESRGDIAQGNRDAFGRYRLKSGSPFSSLGVLSDPTVGADGGGLTVRSEPEKGSALAQQMADAGVTFERNGNGDGFIVSIPVGQVDSFFQKFASGGMVSGPGSGTSDSIMARLSNGEFVVNAAATRQHLPLLEQINSGMPGFKDGGQIKINIGGPAKSSVQVGGGTKAPAKSSGSAPSIAPFSQPGSIQTSGTIKATNPAEYKTEVVSASNSFSRGLTAIGKGLGVIPGYNQVSAGKTRISTENSAWNEMRKPSAPTKLKLGEQTTPFFQSVIDNILGGKSDIPAGVSGKVYGPSSLPSAAPSAPKSAPGPAAAPAVTAPVAKPPAATAPLAAEAGFADNQNVTGRKPGPMPVVANTPSNVVVDPRIASVVTQAGGAYGLPVGTSINYGQPGFPSWVYSLGSQFNMVASTYSGHQEGSGQNKGIDWAPNGVSWNTPQGAEMMTRYAKYLASTGIMEQVIYQNPFTGETVGVFNGKPVGPGTDQPQYYADDWAGHQDHIHTRTSIAIPGPGMLQGLMPGSAMSLSDVVDAYISGNPGAAGSPSNMPAASTPTGIGLPQLTFTNGGVGLVGAGGAPVSGEQLLQNYIKIVSDSWSNIIENLVKNAGSIALQFVGSFFGLDFSQIIGAANAVMGDVGGGVESLFNPEGGDDSAANLPAIPELESLITGSGLPQEVQQYIAQTASQAVANGEDSNSVAGNLRGLIAQARQQLGIKGGGASVSYNPGGGAEQWRPFVQAALNNVAQQYGITNIPAWTEDILGQIQLESNGDPNAANLNDTDGKGGTQQVFGLGQFLPETFAKHNKTGGSINDPQAQIYAMIDYLASPKYGVIPGGGVNWKGAGWRNGKGYATGGSIQGPGSGTSDSILARVSNGEFIVRASQAGKHLGLLNAINDGVLPKYADGGLIKPPLMPGMAPPPVEVPPPPPPPPVVPDATKGPGAPSEPVPTAPQVTPDPLAPSPVDPAVGDPLQQAVGLGEQLGSAIGGIGGGLQGAESPSGADPAGDPRAVMAQGPKNLDHNHPAVTGGIQAGAAAVGAAISTAMQAASMGASMGASAAAAPAMGAASSLISGVTQAAGGAISGAVNVLSSLMVGTLSNSPGGQGGAYGTPLLPGGKQPQGFKGGPGVVNNWGGVTTSNPDEFYRIQQRKELQNASPFLARR